MSNLVGVEAESVLRGKLAHRSGELHAWTVSRTHLGVATRVPAVLLIQGRKVLHGIRGETRNAHDGLCFVTDLLERNGH